MQIEFHSKGSKKCFKLKQRHETVTRVDVIYKQRNVNNDLKFYSCMHNPPVFFRLHRGTSCIRRIRLSLYCRLIYATTKLSLVYWSIRGIDYCVHLDTFCKCYVIWLWDTLNLRVKCWCYIGRLGENTWPVYLAFGAMPQKVHSGNNICQHNAVYSQW